MPLCRKAAICLCGGEEVPPSILDETTDFIARLATAIKVALPPTMGDVSGFRSTFDVLRKATIQSIQSGNELTESARQIVCKLRNPFITETDNQFNFWL